MISIEDIMHKDSVETLEKEYNALREKHPDVSVQTICKRGPLAKVTTDLCGEMPVDLIVMGTTGSSGWAGKLFGSNTSKLLSTIQVPVLTVPEQADVTVFPQRVMVATDLLHYVRQEVFEPLRKLIEPFGSKVEFVNVIDADRSTRKLQKEKAAHFDDWFDADYHPFHFKEHNDIESAILDYMDTHPAHLFVVIAQQRGFWENLFHKSITRSLAKHAKVPLLVLPSLKS